MADGFLGRWSRRKLDVAEGRPVPAQPPAAPPVAAPAAVVAAPTSAAPLAAPVPEPLPPPTLEDVAGLTPESDFSRFAGPGVAPEVTNAAMKTLFSDPHFNVMDGLDIYIGDYNTPDPMPASMLKSLVSADFLGLFREDERKHADVAGAIEAPHEPAPQSLSSQPPPAAGAAEASTLAAVPDPAPVPVPDPHATDADPHLRLQQDHAPGPQGPGDGAR